MSYVVLETFDKSQSEQAFLKCNKLNEKKFPESRTSYKFFIIKGKNELKLCEEKEIEEIKEDLREREFERNVKAATKKENKKMKKPIKYKKRIEIYETLEKIIELRIKEYSIEEITGMLNITYTQAINYLVFWKKGIYKDFKIKYDPKIHDFRDARLAKKRIEIYEKLEKIIDFRTKGHSIDEITEILNIDYKRITAYLASWRKGMYDDFKIKYDSKIHNFKPMRRKK